MKGPSVSYRKGGGVTAGVGVCVGEVVAEGMGVFVGGHVAVVEGIGVLLGAVGDGVGSGGSAPQTVGRNKTTMKSEI